ncbi:MAG: hypothetical protein JWQ04_1813 [Pedosphaera sp.]|nr:hypothetical protein [Pedosphaera sp.]
MRILTLLLIVLSTQTHVNAQSMPPVFKDSLAVDDISVRIYYLKQATNLSADEKISVSFLSHTNATATFFFPKAEYICRMQLFDTNGVIVPKTGIGKQIGEKFDSLDGYSWDAVNKRGHNTGGSEKPDLGVAHVNSGTGRDFAPVDQLFEVKDHKDYVLSLQFQLFKLIGDETNHTFKLVRLPTIEIPVSNQSK